MSFCIKTVEAELNRLEEEVGDRAEVSLTISGKRGRIFPEPVRVALYPQGMANTRLVAAGQTVTGTLAEVRNQWLAKAAAIREATLRKMALEIVRLTDELGECTDAALRQKFGVQDVEQLAEEAVERANRMAGKGPFTVRRMGGDNGAPAESEDAA